MAIKTILITARKPASVLITARRNQNLATTIINRGPTGATGAQGPAGATGATGPAGDPLRYAAVLGEDTMSVGGSPILSLPLPGPGVYLVNIHVFGDDFYQKVRGPLLDMTRDEGSYSCIGTINVGSGVRRWAGWSDNGNVSTMGLTGTGHNIISYSGIWKTALTGTLEIVPTNVYRYRAGCSIVAEKL